MRPAANKDQLGSQQYKKRSSQKKQRSQARAKLAVASASEEI